MIKSLRTSSNEELLNEIDKCLEEEEKCSRWEAGTYFFSAVIIYQNELIRRAIIK